MKTIITLLILITIGCEPIDVKIKDKFDFDINAQFENIGKINSEMPVLVTIKPEKQIESNSYTLSYEHLEGQGMLKSNGIILQEKQEYEVQDLSELLKFQGTSIGNHRINLIVTDNNQNRVHHKISFSLYEDNDFRFTSVASVLSTFYFKKISFNFSIDEINNGSPEELKYSLKYETNGFPAKIIINDVEYSSGETIENISEGKFEGILSGDQPGIGNIKFTLTSSLGTSKTISHQIEFQPVNFEVDIHFDNENPTKEEFVGIHFSINEEIAGLDEGYQMKYFINNKSFNLLRGNDCSTPQTQAGEYFPINRNFTLNFSGCNKAYKDEVEIIIFIKNDHVEKKFTKTISIKPFDFEFSVKPSRIDQNLDKVKKTERFSLDYVVALDNSELSITNYYMTITSNLGSGSIDYFTGDYGNGASFQLNHADNWLGFTSGVSGEAILTFEVTAVDSGFTKTKTMKVTFID